MTTTKKFAEVDKSKEKGNMKNKENILENQLLQQLQKINEGEKEKLIDFFFSEYFLINMVNSIG